MHCPFSHWNWDAEHMGQLSSSLWSSHSGNPSHRHAIGIQSISPVAQVNWSGEQVGGSGERENRSELYTQFYPFQQSKSMRAFFKKSTLIPSLEFFCDYAKILAKRKTWFCIGNEILPTSKQKLDACWLKKFALAVKHWTKDRSYKYSTNTCFVSNSHLLKDTVIYINSKEYSISDCKPHFKQF